MTTQADQQTLCADAMKCHIVIWSFAESYNGLNMSDVAVRQIPVLQIQLSQKEKCAPDLIQRKLARKSQISHKTIKNDKFSSDCQSVNSNCSKTEFLLIRLKQLQYGSIETTHSAVNLCDVATETGVP